MSIYEKAKKAKFKMEFALLMMQCGRDQMAAEAFDEAFKKLEEIIEGEEQEAAA